MKEWRLKIILLIAMKYKHCSFSLIVRYLLNTVSTETVINIYLLYGLL